MSIKVTFYRLFELSLLKCTADLHVSLKYSEYYLTFAYLVSQFPIADSAKLYYIIYLNIIVLYIYRAL